jgi:hypothetical protein
MWLKEKEIAQNRYDQCKKCDSFNKILFFCEKCGCIMKVKVKLKDAKCPLGKW